MEIELVKLDNNQYTIKVDGRFLLSKYNPYNECKKYLSTIMDSNKKNDNILYFIFCSYPGYLQKILIEDYQIDRSNIFVYNPYEIIDLDIYNTNVHNISKKEDIITLLEERFSDGYNVNFIALESFKRVFEKEYNEFFQYCKNQIKTAKENLSVDCYFSKIWCINLIRNLKLIKNRKAKVIDKKSINRIKYPIMVNASGPSLIENIELIRKYRDRFILISVLSSAESLRRLDIKPDFYFITDAGVANILHGYRINEDVPIIADIYSNSAFLSKVRNQIYFYNLLDEIEETSFGLKHPTVSIDAGLFALTLTDNDIYYCGFDLCYSNVYGSHSPGNQIIELRRMNNTRINSIFNNVYSFYKRKDLIFHNNYITNRQFLAILERYDFLKDRFIFLKGSIFNKKNIDEIIKNFEKKSIIGNNNEIKNYFNDILIGDEDIDRVLNKFYDKIKDKIKDKFFLKEKIIFGNDFHDEDYINKKLRIFEN